jgi:hypothetical protein
MKQYANLGQNNEDLHLLYEKYNGKTKNIILNQKPDFPLHKQRICMSLRA